MGLSNEERLNKMYWAAQGLSEAIRELQPKKDEDLYPDDAKWERLLALGDQVWHQLLGKSCKFHWFIGGALTNPVRRSDSPWAVLIQAQCQNVQEARKNLAFFGSEEIGDASEAECPDPFNEYLSLRGLLRHSGKLGGRRALLIDVYSWAEFMAYGLRRYDDEFVQDFPGLDKMISDIMGALFDLMHKDTAFAKAYVGERVLKAIYGQWNGPMWHALNAVDMHYQLNSFMHPDVSLGDVIDLDKWRISHKDTRQNRLVLALRIAGPGMVGVPIMETLIKETRGLNIREASIRREFTKNKVLHEQQAEDRKAKQDKHTDDYIDRSGQAENITIHGYDYLWED